MKKNEIILVWKKIGIILEKLPEEDWSKSHLQFPAVLVNKKLIKVFVTTRPNPESNGKNVTYIRSFDLKLNNNLDTENFSKQPILKLGQNGAFDQFGTMPGDFVKYENSIFMYYTGWNRLDKVPYNFSVGLAISKDNGDSFKKYSEGPIIGQNIHSPYTTGSGAVIYNNNIFHMFCISGVKWIEIEGKLEHTYTIKHAVSENGVDWKFIKGNVINQINEFEAIAAPTVIKIKDIYHMWFSYRGSLDFRGGKDSYKIGYAYSTNLYDWIRDDEKSGISLSHEGWDSEMICYPYVFEYEEQFYMLYNGNNFGKNSIGLAKLNTS